MMGEAERGAGRLLAALVLAGLVVSILAVIASELDGRLVGWAATLPEDARSWGTLMSRLGETGYLFAVSATVAIGSVVCRAFARSEQALLALGCMAERATFVFAVVAVTAGATQVVKQSVGRGRPPVFDQDGAFSLNPFSLTDAYASFPSGHSSNSFAVAVALSLLAPRLAVPLVILAVAVASSRVVVGAHYASDITAGSAFGVVCTVLSARLFATLGIAFVRRNNRVTLKAPGAVAASLGL